MRSIFAIILIAFVYFCKYSQCSLFENSRLGVKYNANISDNSFYLEFYYGDDYKITGQFGMPLPNAIGLPIDCKSENPSLQMCYQWNDYAKFVISGADSQECAQIIWTSKFAQRLEDCYVLEDNSHWYGGGEQRYQHWPIEKQNRPEVAVVTADFFGDGAGEFAGITENYWLNSKGFLVHVDEDVPLFFSLNTTHQGRICFSAQNKYPFQPRDELKLSYKICGGNNAKDVHIRNFHRFYDVPQNMPDENMIIYPIWSTWAQYKTDVNQSIVIKFGDRIKSEGFLDNSQLEIDDDWESDYGEHEFNPEKFPNPKAMVDQLKEKGFRVTLWIHPFINFDSPSFASVLKNGYLVKDNKGKTGITGWWQGGNTGIFDFTNPSAVNYWNNRLNDLKTSYGIDSFKFDAGETNWLPYAAKFEGDDDLQPNLYTSKFVEAMSAFGDMIEVRAARRSQKYGFFFRMLDKESNWGYDNGLRTLIPTLLHFGIVGYPFVLPDMIGGNAYGDKPSKELYIRWMQANVFMPSVQISIVPWDYDSEVIEITKECLNLRETYKNELLNAARQATIDGTPINRPIWWVEPTDEYSYTIDDEYMLGDKILCAPVLEEGQVTRNIYLPKGNWKDPNQNSTFNGPILIQNYPANLRTIPYFILE